MGMSIYNNLAAMSALHENNRNEKSLSKILKQAASGMKINSAGDDASGYAISEKMRIKLRALDQNDRNVKNGSSMLKVASGAIQEQTNLLKTIKQKVIDASNDTNNDHDREVIQKEIDQYYSQMQDIVYDTEFNGEKILMGNAVSEVVSSWEKKDIPTLADDSEIPGLLPDATEASLDGQQGPFATFGKSTDDVPYDGYNQKIESPANIWNKYSSSSNINGDYLVGASTVKPDKAEPTIMEIDLSGYPFSAANKSALDNKSFSIRIPWPYDPFYSEKTFTLTTDTSTKNADYMIALNRCSSSDDVAKAISNAVNKDLDIQRVYDIKASGSKVTFETKEAGAVTAKRTDQYNVSGVGIDGRSEASKTGLFIDGAFTGGEDLVGHWESQPDPTDPDRLTDCWVEDKPATKATFSIPNITSVKSGTGITITDFQYGIDNAQNSDKDKDNGEYRYKYNATQYLEFKEDNSALAYDKQSGHWTIGKNYKGTFYIPDDTQLSDGTIINCKGMKITMDNGNFMAETYGAGKREGEQSFITDGISKVSKTNSLGGISRVQEGDDGDGKYAHWDFDLSAYNISSESMVNALINDYKGRTLEIPDEDVFRKNYTQTYEFIDTGSSDAMDGLWKYTSSTKNIIDLNDVRNEVKNGKTVAEAFALVVSTRINNNEPTEIYGRPVTTFRAELIKSDGTSAPPRIQQVRQLQGLGLMQRN